MSSPDSKGPTLPKPHPACPGRRRCRISGCIHNASSNSSFSTDGIINSLDLFGANGMHGGYSSVRLFAAGGWLYQRPEAASERMNIGGVHVEAKNCATIGNTAYLAPTKFREVSSIMLARMRCWLNSEMPV